MKKIYKDEDNYHVQNGCYNCKKCFIQMEYDDHDQYFCHLDGSKRPKCGSVLMDEDFWGSLTKDISDDDSKEVQDAKFKKAEAECSVIWDEWEAWIVGRSVRAWGICDEWEMKEDESGNCQIY